MKIQILGSMAFINKMLKVKEQLEREGHHVQLPHDANKFLNEPDYTTDDHKEDLKFCIENNVMKTCFKLVEKSDAVLVTNYLKYDLEGYIGAHTLMEIAIAYHYNKKVFLLYPPSNIEKARSTHEILITQPIIINGDLNKIK